jgi:hypothetical protein
MGASRAVMNLTLTIVHQSEKILHLIVESKTVARELSSCLLSNRCLDVIIV